MSASLASVSFIATCLRWTARLVALMMGGLILLLAVGEGFNPAKLTLSELVLSVPFFVAWVGLWLGCRWECVGGILVVTGVAAFCLIHFAQTGFGRFPSGWAFPLFATPGILFLASWWLHRKMFTVPTSP
jgi:hypothetical protein